MEQGQGDRQADGADGDDAELHITPGELGRQDGADTDPQGRRQEEIAAVGLRQPHLLHPIADQVQLDKGTDEHEVSLADYRQHQVPVVADGPDRADDLRREEGDVPTGIGTGSGVHAGGGPEPSAGHQQGEEACLPEAAPDRLGQGRGEHGAEDDRQVGEGLDQAIGPTELLPLRQLRDHPVFGRCEEGAVDPHHEDHPVEPLVPPHGKCRHPAGGHRHLHRLHRHDDPGLSQPVGQAAGRGREEQKGEYEGGPHCGGDHAGLVGTLDPDQAVDDQELEDVVVHGPHELGRVEAPEGGGEFVSDLVAHG